MPFSAYWLATFPSPLWTYTCPDDTSCSSQKCPRKDIHCSDTSPSFSLPSPGLSDLSATPVSFNRSWSIWPWLKHSFYRKCVHKDAVLKVQPWVAGKADNTNILIQICQGIRSWHRQRSNYAYNCDQNAIRRLTRGLRLDLRDAPYC